MNSSKQVVVQLERRTCVVEVDREGTNELMIGLRKPWATGHGEPRCVTTMGWVMKESERVMDWFRMVKTFIQKFGCSKEHEDGIGWNTYE